MNLAEHRRRRRPPITQRQLAALAGVSPARVAQFETGVDSPKFYSVAAQRVANVLRIPAADVVEAAEPAAPFARTPQP